MSADGKSGLPGTVGRGLPVPEADRSHRPMPVWCWTRDATPWIEGLRIRKNSRCQRGPDHPREIGADVRLRQQQHAGVEAAMMYDGVLGITRRIKHLESRAPFQRLGRQLTAV